MLKANDDLVALIKTRIADHKAEEEKRAEAQRERIRKEEEARAQRDAEAKAERERQRIREEERQRAQREAASQPKPDIESTGDNTRAAVSPPAVAVIAAIPEAGAAPTPAGACITLGKLNSMIAPLSISADGLAEIGFHPARIDRAAKLYNVADLPRIFGRLAQRLVDAARSDALARVAA